MSLNLCLFFGVTFLDSTVTPIGPPDDNGHGRIIESDSLSDFYLNDVKQKRYPKHHRKKKSYYQSEHTEDEGIIKLDKKKYVASEDFFFMLQVNIYFMLQVKIYQYLWISNLKKNLFTH